MSKRNSNRNLRAAATNSTTAPAAKDIAVTSLPTSTPVEKSKPRQFRIAQSIQDSYRNRLPLSLPEFKEAREMARRAFQRDRRRLYELYEDSELDNHVKSQLRTRRLKVLAEKFVVLDATGKPNKELTKLFKKGWFEEFISHCIDTKFYGYSLLEFGKIIQTNNSKFADFEDVFSWPRTLLYPDQGQLLLTSRLTAKYQYRNPDGTFNSPWLLELGKLSDYGELESIVPEVIFKRYSRADWQRFAEKFGLPTVALFTTETSQSALDTKEAYLRNFGNNSYLLGDKDTDELQFLESKSSTGNAHLVFKESIIVSNEEISKGISGQTGTTDQKAFVGAAEVHERILDDYHTSDLRYANNIIQTKLIPRLLDQLNWPLEGCEFVFDAFIEKPNPDKAKPPKKDAEPDVANFIKPSAITAVAEGKEPRFQLEALADQISAFRNLNTCCHHIEAADKENSLLSKLFNSIFNKHLKKLYKLFGKKEQLTNKEYQPFLQELTSATGTHLSKGFETAFKKEAESRMFTFKDEAFVRKAQESIFTFSGAKSLNQLILLREVIIKDGKTLPFTEFRAKAIAINKEWNQTWLRTEYDSVLQTATMASKWQDIEAQKKTYPYLVYKIVGDALVRPEHQALSGIVRKVDDAFWKSYYPPNGWNCRCTVTQLRKADETPNNDQFEERIKKAKVDPYFKFNPGIEGRVFDRNIRYFKTICGANLSACDPQKIMKQLGGYEAKALHNFLLDECDYQYLEGTKLSKNGAFLIHPKNWLKSDIVSAKQCWPAMEKSGLQFIGIENPKGVNGIFEQNFDGMLNGVSSELKFVVGGKQDVWSTINRDIRKANAQGAENVVIALDQTYDITDDELDRIQRRALGVLKVIESENSLKTIYFLSKNKERIISR